MDRRTIREAAIRAIQHYMPEADTFDLIISLYNSQEKLAKDSPSMRDRLYFQEHEANNLIDCYAEFDKMHINKVGAYSGTKEESIRELIGMAILKLKIEKNKRS